MGSFALPGTTPALTPAPALAPAPPMPSAPKRSGFVQADTANAEIKSVLVKIRFMEVCLLCGGVVVAGVNTGAGSLELPAPVWEVWKTLLLQR